MRILLAVALFLAATQVAFAAPKESFVEAPGPLGPLKGTMLSPSPNAPVVLMIPGSGPTDRDGNSGLGIKASSSKLLAEALAAQGIASVRADKRGLLSSAGAVADGNNVTIEDYAADAHAWIGVIRKTTGAKCVWLAGHSEGALIALAAAKAPADICGLVLISGAGRKLGDVMREQFKANPATAPLLPQALAAIDDLEHGKRVDDTALHPALKPVFAAPVQGFLINQFALDPARLLAAYRGPALILQGTTDLQVTMTDAELLAAAKPDAKLIKLEGVNHVLKQAPLDRAANYATYANPDLPLAPGVADAIAAFIKAKR